MNRTTFHLTRLEDRCVPAAATWTGGGADNKWSTAANWAGNHAPAPGDDVVFPAGAARLDSVNDSVVAFVLASLSVTGAGYQISGNAVTVSGGIHADVPAGDASVLGLPLGGAGGLTKAGPGALALAGPDSYAGATAVNAGTLEVRSDTALGATGAGNGTAVADGATLALNGTSLTVAEPIAFTGRGVPGQFFTAGAIELTGGTVTLSGPLTLTGNALITGGKNAAAGPLDRLTITAGVAESGGSFGLQLDVDLVVFAASSVNTYTGPTDVLEATAEFDGRGGSGLTTVGGVLAGTGTLGPVRGGVWPGRFDAQKNFVPGVLTVGDFEGGETTFITPAGAGRLVVHGTVRGGGARLIADRRVQLHPGDTIVVAENDGTDPVDVLLPGSPEGPVTATRAGDVRLSYHGGDGNDVTLTVVSRAAWAVGAGPGGGPQVNVYDNTGGLVRAFNAYDPAFRGGVRVATADFNGDDVPDIVTAPGPGGGPHMKVFDGATGSLIREWMAYDPAFRGGVNLATAFIDNDEVPDIITGAGAGGGPHVKVFSGKTGAEVLSFMAYDPAFTGGVNVAGGIVANNGPPSIVTGPGAGGGPDVRIFDTRDGRLVSEFLAYDPAFRGGVNVAVGFLPEAFGGRVNFYSAEQIVTGPGPGGGPEVRVFNGDGRLDSSFLAYDPAFRGGVTVAVVGPSDFGSPPYFGGQAILTGAGPGGGPLVGQWDSPALPAFRGYYAFDPAFTGGVFVG